MERSQQTPNMWHHVDEKEKARKRHKNKEKTTIIYTQFEIKQTVATSFILKTQKNETYNMLTVLFCNFIRFCVP